MKLGGRVAPDKYLEGSDRVLKNEFRRSQEITRPACSALASSYVLIRGKSLLSSDFRQDEKSFKIGGPCPGEFALFICLARK